MHLDVDVEEDRQNAKMQRICEVLENAKALREVKVRRAYFAQGEFTTAQMRVVHVIWRELRLAKVGVRVLKDEGCDWVWRQGVDGEVISGLLA